MPAHIARTTRSYFAERSALGAPIDVVRQVWTNWPPTPGVNSASSTSPICNGRVLDGMMPRAHGAALSIMKLSSAPSAFMVRLSSTARSHSGRPTRANSWSRSKPRSASQVALRAFSISTSVLRPLAAYSALSKSGACGEAMAETCAAKRGAIAPQPAVAMRPILRSPKRRASAADKSSVAIGLCDGAPACTRSASQAGLTINCDEPSLRSKNRLSPSDW